MSDVPPPPPPPDLPSGVPPEPDPTAGTGGPPTAPVDAVLTDAPEPTPGLWQRYRSLPMWVQILIPVVIIAIIVFLIAALAGSGDDDDGASSDTTISQDSSIDDVLKGIIIVGGINGDSTTTTTIEATTTTAEPTTTTAPATTTTAAATAPTTPSTPTTVAPTAPPTTKPPVTVPPTEPPPTEAPPTTAPAGPLPTPADFVTQWNAAAAGTDVPTISSGDVTEITQGPFAGAFELTLTPTSGGGAARVGLIGTVSEDRSQLTELVLVWVGDSDDDASAFYWDAFGVLSEAVSPGITTDEITAIETSLGKADGVPPFATAGASDTSGDLTFQVKVGATQDGDPASGITVS